MSTSSLLLLVISSLNPSFRNISLYVKYFHGIRHSGDDLFTGAPLKREAPFSPTSAFVGDGDVDHISSDRWKGRRSFDEDDGDKGDDGDGGRSGCLISR